MAQPFSSYSVENDKAFKAALRKVGKKFSDLRVPLGLIAKDFYKSEKAIFLLKSPGLYPDLAPSTKLDKKNQGFPLYPILKRTGRLEKSITGPDSDESIFILDKQELTIGTNVPYGIYHQSDEPRNKLPLRKFLFIGPEAPRFATSEQKGRLERWIGILEGFAEEAAEDF